MEQIKRTYTNQKDDVDLREIASAAIIAADIVKNQTANLELLDSRKEHLQKLDELQKQTLRFLGSDEIALLGGAKANLLLLKAQEENLKLLRESAEYLKLLHKSIDAIQLTNQSVDALNILNKYIADQASATGLRKLWNNLVVGLKFRG